MNLSMRYLSDLGERAAKTFAQAYVAIWATLGDADWDALFTLDNLKVAGAAAVMSVLTSIASKSAGNPDSASVLPPQAQPPAPQPPEQPDPAQPLVVPPLEAAPPVQPPIVAAAYSARLGKWVTVYLRPVPYGTGTFTLAAGIHNGLPVAEEQPGGPFATIGPEALSSMGLREVVPHPDADGN